VLDERLQAGFQSVLAGLGEFEEAEGLEPSLRGPHGKHNFCALADGGFTEMEDEFNFQFFVEGLFQMHEAAAGGKLMQFGANLPLVRQANNDQDRTAKLDPKRTLPVARSRGSYGSRGGRGIWSLRHCGESIAPGQTRHEVTKEREGRWPLAQCATGNLYLRPGRAFCAAAKL